jgi:hypothetical protein
MNLQWQSALVGLLSCSVAVAPALAQTLSKGKEPGKKSESSETKAFSFSLSGDVDVDQVIEKIKASISNSKLSEEQQDKIMDGVKKALSGANKGTQRGTQSITVVGTENQDDENSTKLELKILGVDGKQMVLDGKPMMRAVLGGQGVRLFAQENRDHKAMAEEFLKALKEHKVSEEVIADIEKRLERLAAKPMAMPPAGGIVPPRDADRYVIGVALRSSEEDEEGDDEDKAEFVIEDVFADSPAAKADLREGDVVVKVNEKELDDVQELAEIVQSAGKKGKAVVIELRRGEKSITKEVKPAKRSLEQYMFVPQGLLGKTPGAFVLPKGSQMGQWVFSGFDAKEEMEALHKDIESLKAQLSEIKEMLKSLKKD